MSFNVICPPRLSFCSSSTLKSDKCPFPTLETLLIETYLLLKQAKRLEKTQIVVQFLLCFVKTITMKCFFYLDPN